MENILQTHYRCPAEWALPAVRPEGRSQPPGFFRMGSEALAYGRLLSPDSLMPRASQVPASAPEIAEDLCLPGLPFDPEEVLDNLRFERYLGSSHEGNGSGGAKSFVRNAYYAVRPLLPVAVRKYLQRIHLRGWDQIPFPRWPVDCSVEILLERLLILSLKARGVDRMPFIWFWPNGHRAAMIMTHDVETAVGRDYCPTLLALNGRYRIRCSLQLIPELRYEVSASTLKALREKGAEINVHDLNHDGHLYDDRAEFLRRVEKINQYGRAFGARGFRAGVLYRNLDWYDSFDFSYDMTVPNVAHLDPQRGGCCTIFPFSVGKILEIPLTMTQDYTLFHIFNNYSIDLWKTQVGLVLARHGLISFNVHPDYIMERRAGAVYEELLRYLVQLRDESDVWMALPGDVDVWWRARQQMRLVPDRGGWRIEGPESDRARLAYACWDGERITYQFEPPVSKDSQTAVRQH
jgi:hypothetical protein